MLCAIMPNTAMLNLTADSRLAFKVILGTNTLAYSATANHALFLPSVIMPSAAMLNLIANSRLAYKVMWRTNSLAYSATMKNGHYALCHNH
jgi:hypothetical protein